MKFIQKKIGKKNDSPYITEIDENDKKRKTKNQYVTVLTEFFSEMGIYRGRIVPLNVEKKSELFKSLTSDLLLWGKSLKLLTI